MATSITVIHIHSHSPNEVEQVLEAIFRGEERPRLLRIEGMFSAVLLRLNAMAQEASYRYLICRPATGSGWTPVLELGNHTVGLEVLLSSLLEGCAVCTVFVYGDTISGYRLARNGAEVDRYTSDPSILRAGSDELDSQADGTPEDEEVDYELERGRPERFADLLPSGTSAEDFARVVLQPGWWEEHDQLLLDLADDLSPGGMKHEVHEEDEDLVELVDEVDRMRCIALALELFGPSEYPFTGDIEDIPNRIVGPAIALAFA